MSDDLIARIWAALDAAGGDVIEATFELGDALRQDGEMLTAVTGILMPLLLTAADPVMSPFRAQRWDDERLDQALREWSDPRENPHRVQRLEAAVMEAFLRALADVIAAELPRWRAARGGPDPSGA